MKTASLPVYAIFAIVSGIIALALFFLFVAVSTGYPKSIYCNTLHKFKSNLWFPTSVDEPYCNSENAIDMVKIGRREFVLTRFSNDLEKVSFQFEDAQKKASFDLPASSKIASAELYISGYNEEAPINGVALDFNGIDYPIYGLTPSPQKFDFREALTTALDNCNENICKVTITLSSEKGSVIILESLKIAYETCPIEQDLARYTKKCLDLEKTMFCYELIIPEDCGMKKPLTEEDFTAFLIEKNMCSLLPNKDFRCGDDDKIQFLNNIKSPMNVLIEYQNGKVQIS